MQQKPKPISTATITRHIARSSWTALKLVHTMRQEASTAPKQRSRRLRDLERELDAARYWMALWLDERQGEQKLTKRAVIATHDLLALAAAAVEKRRQR